MQRKVRLYATALLYAILLPDLPGGTGGGDKELIGMIYALYKSTKPK